jgi:hypothetical protein
MSKTATKTTEQDAAAELEQAEQGVREILDRIKDGDKKVGPEDLEKAESRVRFARARLEGEERRREEEAERERLQRLEELKERAAKEFGPETVQGLREKAEKALSAYVAACVAHNTAIEEVADELSILGPLPAGWRIEHGSAGRTFSAGGHSVFHIRPTNEVSRIAYDALREHIPHGAIELLQF